LQRHPLGRFLRKHLGICLPASGVAVLEYFEYFVDNPTLDSSLIHPHLLRWCMTTRRSIGRSSSAKVHTGGEGAAGYVRTSSEQIHRR
jgi:hypothetical protein